MLSSVFAGQLNQEDSSSSSSSSSSHLRHFYACVPALTLTHSDRMVVARDILARRGWRKGKRAATMAEEAAITDDGLAMGEEEVTSTVDCFQTSPNPCTTVNLPLYPYNYPSRCCLPPDCAGPVAPVRLPPVVRFGPGQAPAGPGQGGRAAGQGGGGGEAAADAGAYCQEAGRLPGRDGHAVVLHQLRAIVLPQKEKG